MIRQTGCINPYTPGRITITSGTGKVEGVQNYIPGWTETVCIRCENSHGSYI